MIDWLLGTLLATSGLIVLVLVLREPVRRQFGARIAYGLWLIPAARLMMPPLTRTVERAVPDVAVVAMQPASTAAPDPTLLDQLGGWPTLLLAVWLGVALGLFVNRAMAFRRERASILASGVELARLGSIRLVRSPGVRGPIAFGIFDRVIAVPVDFDRRFGDCERRLALDHELAHHRSGDLAANLFAFTLLCLQWFNPLAWVAHAAFRFDQEAACDARVLDKANGHDRAEYGLAIAKAASGGTLLFAGALDRPSTLSRRLMIMTYDAKLKARKFGFVLIGGAIFIALPLTATWAIKYVDVADAAPSSPVAPKPAAIVSATVLGAPPEALADGTVVLPGGVKLGKGSVAFLEKDNVLINGKTKRLEQLTRAERSELRAVIAKSRAELERERAELPARLAEVRRETDHIRSGAFKRELMEAREDLRRDFAEIDSQAAELRASGHDPEKLKAEIRESLREAEAIDIDKEIREGLAELNTDKIIAELRNAAEQLARMQARLDRLDRAGN